MPFTARFRGRGAAEAKAPSSLGAARPARRMRKIAPFATDGAGVLVAPGAPRAPTLSIVGTVGGTHSGERWWARWNGRGLQNLHGEEGFGAPRRCAALGHFISGRGFQKERFGRVSASPSKDLLNPHGSSR